MFITIGDGGNREGLAEDYLDQPDYSAFRFGVYADSFGLYSAACHESYKILLTTILNAPWLWVLRLHQAHATQGGELTGTGCWTC